MNKERRAELYDVVASLDEAADRLDEIYSDEEEAYDNLTPGLQCGKTGDSMQNALSQIDNFRIEIGNVRAEIEKMAKGKK